MKNGARRDQAAISPPIAGPLIPPIRNPPENRPLARPRCSLGTLPSSRVWALTLNIAEPSPPTPRKTMSCVNDPETGWQRPGHAEQGEGADHAGGGRGAHPEMTGERRDSGGDDPEPERDRERDRGEDRHLARQVTERSATGEGHERQSASRARRPCGSSWPRAS